MTDEVLDTLTKALYPHIGYQEYLGDAVWRCPCGSVWCNGKHLAEAVTAALADAGYVVLKKQELLHRTSAENCKQGWIYGTPISSGHVCQLCEAEK